MGMLETEVLNAVRIERMIFHVIGPDENDLMLMDEIDVTGLETFFLERIKETNTGNRFYFIGPTQGVRPSLAAIASDPSCFVSISKNLAESFQNQHKNVGSKRGAFIVASLSGLPQTSFALIKFDDLRVLRFRHEQNKDGKIKAIVSEIDNTFQEDRKAMQKSAFILLTEDGGNLAVYDRSNRKNVTDYFRAFLGVKRLYTAQQATERLYNALHAAFTKHQKKAPPDIRATWRTRLYDATRKLELIDLHDEKDMFGATVFGDFWKDSDFQNSLQQCLQAERISGEAIDVQPDAIKKPNVRRIKTFENIYLRIPDGLGKDIIHIEESADGQATITIHTREITTNELVDETLSKTP